MKYVVDVLASDEDPNRCDNELMRRDAERLAAKQLQ